MNDSPLTVEFITDDTALASLQAEWQALSRAVSEHTDFFTCWDYVSAFIRVHQAPNWQVLTFRVAATRQLVGVFPIRVFQLTGNDGRTYRSCQPLGPGLVPYLEFPIHSDHRRPVLQSLINTALQQQLKIDVALFWPLHETSALYRVLLEDFGTQGVFRVHRYPDNSSQIDTWGHDFKAYAQSRTSSTFKNAVYCERRLGKEGRVCITPAEGVDELSPVMAQLCQWNMARYADKHAYHHNPSWAEFITTLATQLTERGLAEVMTLRLDGIPIAAGLSFVYKRCRYFYLYDCDPAFQKYAPKKILLNHLIERSFSKQQVMCFGAGNAAYKRDWVQSMGELKAGFLYLNSQAQAALGQKLDLHAIKSLGGLL